MRNLVLFFCIAFFSLVGCSSNQVTDDIYLIPENYEGYIYIFYHVNGAPLHKQEDKYDVFEVNEDGYFATSAKDMDYGTVTDQYYYFDGQGNRTEIDKECVRTLGTGGYENDPQSEQQIKILYTGIAVTKTACGQDFSLSPEGFDEETFQASLDKVLEIYYEKGH